MVERQNRATLNKGRSGWCVIFRHPMREQGADGTRKLRVRRGLGTRDEADAAKLVDQLNTVLADPTFWNPAARERAMAMFDPRIVAAFFDHLMQDRYDPWGDREKAIALPGRDVGYVTVQFVGTTGAGKTTVVRQLLGTDPVDERFPSTSAAKTTICDIELVMADGPFAAAVSFLPKDQVRQYIAECVAAAVVSHVGRDPESEVVRRFLEHSEQKFRLSYILGTLAPASASADNDLLSDDEAEIDASPAEAAGIDETERQAMADCLRDYVSEIKRLGDQTCREVQNALGESMEEASAKDRDAFEELVELELLKHEDFHGLVDRILDRVESKFESLDDRELTRGRDEWPTLWTHQSEDRAAFIRLTNQFSSNYAPNFGHLLTPLVRGIRAKGPFKPKWVDQEAPRLVLMDGRGIGHTADSTTSISTSTTRRFQLADTIILVDNAAQPMQAAACAVLRSLVSSGHESKLVICFTHFDEVKGDNLVGTEARKGHVIGSFDNAIRSIGKSYGRDSEQALKRLIPKRVVFLSKIQLPLATGNQITRHGLDQIIKLSLAAIQPPGEVILKPVYDVANLILAIQKATQEFHDRWKGILGMGSRAGVGPEHWTRVKALARCIGLLRQDEYDDLRPVADMIQFLQSQVSNYLAVPMEWEGQLPADEQEEQRTQVLDEIKKEVFSHLHELSTRRVIAERLNGWVAAYQLRGAGSTQVRARQLVSIYESAAPIPNETPGLDANRFLLEIRELVMKAIVSGGGQVIGWGREVAVSPQT